MTGTVNNLQIGDFLVYIAGVEVPVEEVQVTYGVNAIPSASISMLADNNLYRLGAEDKVPVAIFYLDQWYGKTKEYRLLFDGDIVNWSYTKSYGGRSLNFQCVGHTSVLTQMFAMFLGGDVDDYVQGLTQGTGQVEAIPIGLKQDFPASLFFKGLGVGGVNKQLERPADFVVNILNILKVGGLPLHVGSRGLSSYNAKTNKESVNYAQNTHEYDSTTLSKLDDIYDTADIRPADLEKFLVGSMSAVMQFFVRYNHKVKFDKRWAATDFNQIILGSVADDVKAKLSAEEDTVFNAKLKQILFQMVMGNVSENFGSTMSFYDIIAAFLNTMLYELMVLPTAPYTAVNEYLAPINPVNSGEVTFDHRLINHIIKPYTHFALPPIFNVIFPSMVSTYAYNEDYSLQNTRLYMGTVTPTELGPDIHGVSDLLIQQSHMYGAPVNVLGEIVRKRENPGKSDKGLLIYPEEYFRGPVLTTRELPGWLTYLKVAEKRSDHVTHKKKEDLTTAGNENSDNVVSEEKVAKKFNGTSSKGGYDGLAQDYANYEYIRQRYSQRNGNASLPFNPYIVPGFPAVILDSPNTNMHLMVYVTNVTHSLSSVNGFSTSVQFTHIRTLQETYEEVFYEGTKNIKDKKTIYSMSPKIPIPELANKFQVEEAAGTFYRNLFYSNDANKKELDCVFNHKKFFAGTDIAANVSAEASGVLNTGTYIVPGTVDINTWNKDNTRINVDLNLIYNESFNKDKMESYESALRYIARPICTLKEYVTFINRGNGFTDGLKKYEFQRRAGKEGEAIGYLKIKNYNPAPNAYIAPTTEDKSNSNETIRKDWVSKLEAYRKNVIERRNLP